MAVCMRACVDAGRQCACVSECVAMRASVRGCLRACMCGYACVRMQGRSPGDKYLGHFLEYCNARFSQYMYANLYSTPSLGLVEQMPFRPEDPVAYSDTVSAPSI